MTITRVNDITNPRAGTDTTNWTSLSGGGTGSIARVATGGPDNGPFVRQSYTVAATDGGAQVGPRYGASGVNQIPLTPAVPTTVSMYVRSNAVRTVRLQVFMYNSSGTSTGGVVSSSYATLVANEWVRLSVTFTPYASTVRGLVQTNATAALGLNVFDATMLLVERSDQLGGYFDGNNLDQPGLDYSWTGTPHASTSTETDTRPHVTLEPHEDADPCPRVDITIDVDGTKTVQIFRTAGGQRLPVRGGRRTVTSADFFVDYEVPLGLEVLYEIADETGLSTSATTQVNSDTAWIQDPLAPAQSSPLVLSTGGGAGLEPGAARQFTAQMPVELINILGSKFPVAQGGTRQAYGGIPFPLFCDTAAATSKIRSILLDAFPVLLRSLPSMSPLDPVAFLSLSSVTERPIDTHIGGNWTRFELDVDQVAAPAVSIVVPIWTYANVSALWATYGTTKGGSYLDWLKDPEP